MPASKAATPLQLTEAEAALLLLLTSGPLPETVALLPAACSLQRQGVVWRKDGQHGLMERDQSAAAALVLWRDSRVS